MRADLVPKQAAGSFFTDPIFYYATSGSVSGPCSLRELERLLRAGTLDATTTIWHKGNNTAALQVLISAPHAIGTGSNAVCNFSSHHPQHVSTPLCRRRCRSASPLPSTLRGLECRVLRWRILRTPMAWASNMLTTPFHHTREFIVEHGFSCIRRY